MLMTPAALNLNPETMPFDQRSTELKPKSQDA
jgi:hypothetical protein